MCDYQVTIKSEDFANYIKLWALTDPNPHTYQGLIDIETKAYDGLGRIKYLYPSYPIQSYSGTFSQGSLTGSGTLWYLDGTIYKGQVTNGKRHGYGTMYAPNGKFEYDGIWANDLIDKPIYKAVMNSSGQIDHQGFQVNGDEFQGWFVTHLNGQVDKIKFYQDNKAIKGFSKSGLNYIVNNPEIPTLSNDQIHKFLFEELVKLNKPNQLQQFLSNETNIKMLEELSFEYDLDTGDYKTIKSYKVFNDVGLSQIYQLNKSNQEIIVSVNTNKNTVFIKTSDELPQVFGSLWSFTANKINLIKLIELPDDEYKLEECQFIAKGLFICTDGIYELNGKGLYSSSSNSMYIGTFVNGKITDGIEMLHNKKIYQGQFNPGSGKYHGVGTEWLVNGKMKYQGDFSNGKYHGNGSSYYVNSDVEAIEYVGQWVNGYRHGQGTLFSVSGDEIFTGPFDHNQIA